MEPTKGDGELSSVQADRRAFLASAGKFAAGVPPSLIVLLSTSMSSSAIAASSGGGTGPSYSEHWGAPTNEGWPDRNGEDGPRENRSDEDGRSGRRGGG